MISHYDTKMLFHSLFVSLSLKHFKMFRNGFLFAVPGTSQPKISNRPPNLSRNLAIDATGFTDVKCHYTKLINSRKALDRVSCTRNEVKLRDLTLYNQQNCARETVV